MKYVNDLIDYRKHTSPNEVIFFTANQVVKRNGELVMGAGNAKAARDNINGAAYAFGKQLGTKRLHVIEFKDVTLGALVTKQHFKNPSNLEFVIDSIEELYNYASRNPNLILHVPYPAIGNGGLSREDLDFYIEQLPDNVYIYYK